MQSVRNISALSPLRMRILLYHWQLVTSALGALSGRRLGPIPRICPSAAAARR